MYIVFAKDKDVGGRTYSQFPVLNTLLNPLPQKKTECIDHRVKNRLNVVKFHQDKFYENFYKLFYFMKVERKGENQQIWIK